MKVKDFLRGNLASTIILCLALFIFQDISGQKQEAPPLRERFFFGGSFGLQFGTVSDVEIAPVAGFWVLPRLAVGAGPEYRYFKYYREKTSIWGGKGYIELTALRNINSIIPIGTNTDIILHLEDELLNLESSSFKIPPYTSERFFLNTILGGVGLSQQIGRRSALNLLVLWTFNQEEYGIYSDPEIRISFVF